MSADGIHRERVQKFLQLWAEGLALVLEQVAGKPFPMAVATEPQIAAASSDKDVYLIATAAGTMRGELALRIPEQNASALVRTFTGREDSGAILGSEEKSALEEIFRQVASYCATSSSEEFHGLSMTVALGPPATWPAAIRGWLKSGAEAPHELAVECQISAALSASLATVPDTKDGSNSDRANSTAGHSGPLEVFMDLELDVTLRFGARELLLKDVLELGPGSVLELDREIRDPADLLLDNKLIARGELVTVNGNYGLRITQTFSNP